MKKILVWLVAMMPWMVWAQEPVGSGYVVKHEFYTLSYVEQHEQPEWVYYMLTEAMVNGEAERGDDFRPDEAVKTGSADLSDYKGSGYDRGHLCPAADMKQSDKAMSETFFMSNMSPQVGAFNRGVWARLEEQVRKWALEDDTLFVVTGPVFLKNGGVIGGNKVTVPGFYYKVLYSPKREQMQAFLLPNRDGLKAKWATYAVSVDLLEWLTGVDFFAAMEDVAEAELECANDYEAWIGKKKGKVDAHKTSVQSGVAQQCKGIAKSTGQRCKSRQRMLMDIVMRIKDKLLNDDGIEFVGVVKEKYYP